MARFLQSRRQLASRHRWRIFTSVFCAVAMFGDTGVSWAQRGRKKVKTIGKVPRRRTAADARRSRENAAEAKRRFGLGKAAMFRGDSKTAEAYFGEAVDRMPKTAEYRYHLALAHEKQKKLGLAWFQLRQAVTANSTHRKGVARLQVYWKMFTRKSWLDVGKSTEEIRKSLGKPDGVIKRGNRERWIYGFYAVDFVAGKVAKSVDRRSLYDAAVVPKRLPDLKPNSDEWILKQRSLSRYQTLLVYRHRKDGEKQNTRLLVRRYIDALQKKPKLDELLNGIRKSMLSLRPKLVWHIIEQKPRHATFECRIPAEKKIIAEHELGRLFLGEKDVHRVSIIRRGGTFTDSERKRYLRLLSRIQLVHPAKLR